MLANQITLEVNDDNDDGTTALVENIFQRFEEYLNRSEYIHTNHTIALRDKLGFYRTPPKTNGNFRGTAKSAAKFTKDFEVAGVDSSTTLTVPAIIEISQSLPVGLTPAQTLELRMRMVALILMDAIMAPLSDQLMV
jgi:hypothetical protein